MSEAALASPQASTTALALEHLWGGRPPAVAEGTGSEWRARRLEGTEPPGARRPILGRVDVELPSAELATIEDPDRLGGFGVARELDEGEAAGPTRLAVRGQVNADDTPRRGEQRGELVLGGPEVQITDEDLCRDGSPPSGSRGTAQSSSPRDRLAAFRRFFRASACFRLRFTEGFS